VWNGDFAVGDFDRTDVVFDSGARRRDGEIVYVSLGRNVDRRQFFLCPDRTYVSNSLACLLAASGAEFDLSYAGWKLLYESVVSQRYSNRISWLLEMRSMPSVTACASS
jgi:hypothetical protein